MQQQDAASSDLTVVDLFAGIGGFSEAFHRAGARTVAVVETDKYCKNVLARHFPDAVQFDDVAKVSGDDLRAAGFAPERGVITGGFPCFPAGTPVLTHRGYCPIEGVSTGDWVLTHRNRWRRVTGIMRRESDVVEVCQGFHATADHPFYARRPRRVWCNEIRRYRRRLGEAEWTKASALGGMFVARPVAVPAIGDPPPPPRGMSWWHVGRWLADGYLHAGTSDPIIAIGKQKAARDLPKFVDSWRVSEERTALKVRLSGGRRAGEWLHRHFGYLAHGKTVAAWALWMPEADRRELLDGYWSGDGSPRGSGMRSASVSHCLTAGIRSLAESLGFTTSVHYVRTSDATYIEGRRVRQRNYWQVHAVPDDGRYTEVTGDGWRWVKLRSSPVPVDGLVEVFDLTVEEDHSFVAAGYVVHNCQDISVAGRGAGLAGERSGLFFHIVRLLEELHPRWFVLENVPRLLSINGGRDMGTVIEALVDCGYGIAWRVLDAQYFGVPQRRRRVFIVGCLGDSGRASAEVLFEPEGGAGDSSAGQKTWPRVAPTLECGANSTGGTRPPGTTVDTAEFLDPLKINTHTHTHISTLQGGGKRGYRIDAEAAAGGHLVVSQP